MDFLMHDIVLIALIIAWLFEWIKCMLYVMFVKLTLMFSWKRSRMQLKYVNIHFLYVCFVMNSMWFGLTPNHLYFFLVSLIY